MNGLGQKEGPAAVFFWAIPSIAPLLVPWLAILALLALPSNRHPRAWLIWLPLGLLAGAAALVAAALPETEFGYFAQTGCSAAFGIAATWLLAEPIARRGLFLSALLTAGSAVGFSVLAFSFTPLASEFYESWRSQPLVLLWLGLFWLCVGVSFAGGMRLAGAACRGRYGWFRVALRLLPAIWACWMAAGMVFFGVLYFVQGGDFQGLEAALGLSVGALVHYGLILPFLALALASSLHRDRLKSLMRLEERIVTLTPAPLPQTVAEQR